MTPISFAAAAARYPQLVEQVVAKLGRTKPGTTPQDVSWYLVDCQDDADQPLDEGVCADILLTGSIPFRVGVCGFVGNTFACFCEGDCKPVESPHDAQK
jgi:hypothetical protein